jgi:hypothetical protein
MIGEQKNMVVEQKPMVVGTKSMVAQIKIYGCNKSMVVITKG